MPKDKKNIAEIALDSWGRFDVWKVEIAVYASVVARTADEARSKAQKIFNSDDGNLWKELSDGKHYAMRPLDSVNP
ncbi:hypothetical protein MUP77_21475 [Candidatus Bathyarchaeota archaeon]|nr:hypothetical protein [Candidatus Bathyarchaeota archaeon]